ncbi:MAG: molybdopterin-binding protein [Desulfurococcaceae archaeon]
MSDSVYEGRRPDESGEAATRLLGSAGYAVRRVFVPNDVKEIMRVLRLERSAGAFILIGGTGPSPRDVTIDVLEDVCWRKFPGFGEYFRAQSLKSVGLRALLTRTELCLLYDGRPLVALPGSPGAVELGIRMFIDILPHLVEEAGRFEGPHSHG